MNKRRIHPNLLVTRDYCDGRGPRRLTAFGEEEAIYGTRLPRRSEWAFVAKLFLFSVGVAGFLAYGAFCGP